MKRTISLTLSAVFLSACITNSNPFTGEKQLTKTSRNAAIGAGVGAVAGLLAGGDDRKNALIGAGIGALVGGGVGVYMDRQEAELRQQLNSTGVSVTRNGNNIILNMPSNITFGTDQDRISPSFVDTLNSVALVLKKYDKTLVDVFGHTDSVGSESYNQALSQRRATNVANYLVQKGSDARRFVVTGYGESRPIASNDSEIGRAENRRVEIRLSPLTTS